MTLTKTNWIRVSRSRRCPVCDSDSWCGISDDGAVVHCQRIESQTPCNGESGGWIHRLSEPRPQRNRTMQPATKEQRPTIDWSGVAKRMYDAGRRDELARVLGVSVDALSRLGVGSGADDFGQREPFWSFPERSGQLKVTGIVRRYWTGAKKMMRWSRSGLYITREWWTVPGPILLVEGGSDVAACLTMGLCVIGRPNNIGGVNPLIGKAAKSSPADHRGWRTGRKTGSARNGETIPG